MQPLAFKVLFRKKGTASAILAVALLIALITSVSCLVNNINAQTTLLSKLAKPSETYLVTEKNSTNLSDSQIDPTLIDKIRNQSSINYAAIQQMVQATLTTNAGNYPVALRGVDDVEAFFFNHQAGVNGFISQKDSQVNIGIILAKLACLDRNNRLNITINGKCSSLAVAGIVQSNQQIDAEITMPLRTLQSITHENATVSLIEFSIQDPAKVNQTLDDLTRILPLNTEIRSTQQVTAFVQDINGQTIVFINLWSIAVYMVVVAASYLTSARAISEAEYELKMFQTLGAKKKLTVNLILVYTLTVAFFGSVIGVSLGIVGTQGASTFVRWVFGNSLLAPYLEMNQALMIVLLGLASALMGSIYPAIKHGYYTSEANIF